MHPSAKLTISELRKKCRNDDYGKFVHRPARLISIYVTKFCLTLGITANMASAFGFCLFLVGFGFFVWPNPLYRVIGIIIMLVAELFDYVDGELARAYGYSTTAGVFLEPFFQDINYTLIFLTVGSSLYFETRVVLFLYLGIAASLGKILFRLTETRFYWHMAKFAPKGVASDPGHQKKFFDVTQKSLTFNPFYWIYRLSLILHHNILSGAPLLYLLAIALYFGRLDWFVWFFGVILPMYWVVLSAMRLRTVLSLKEQAMD